MKFLNVMGASIQEQVSNSQTGTGATGDLQVTVGDVLNVVFGVIAIVSVVFIIIGGINYSTSQGDGAKVKKAKDTILYGIIGLVVSLLAFAIVNFVLKAMIGDV